MANAASTIKDKRLNTLIRLTVFEAVQEILTDPDFGLALRPEFIKRLKKSVKSKKAGRLIPFDEILKKHRD